MSKDQIQAVEEIKDALKDVPESLRNEVAKAVTHDINVMARALDIANTRPE